MKAKSLVAPKQMRRRKMDETVKNKINSLF